MAADSRDVRLGKVFFQRPAKKDLKISGIQKCAGSNKPGHLGGSVSFCLKQAA